MRRACWIAVVGPADGLSGRQRELCLGGGSGRGKLAEDAVWCERDTEGQHQQGDKHGRPRGACQVEVRAAPKSGRLIVQLWARQRSTALNTRSKPACLRPRAAKVLACTRQARMASLLHWSIPHCWRTMREPTRWRVFEARVAIVRLISATR